MPRLTDAQVREILARAEAATLGPWHTNKALLMVFAERREGDSQDGSGDRPIAQMPIAPEIGIYGNREADAVFIAAARTGVPDLAADLLEARAALRALYNASRDPSPYVYNDSRQWDIDGDATRLTDARLQARALLSEAEPRAEALAENAENLKALDAAWGIIANASGGDWRKESVDWREAAGRWRDRYLRLLAEPEPRADVT